MTSFIDPKIRPLVEALNSWEGVETYSSCEGHEGETNPFVSFSCGDKKTVRRICEKLHERETTWRISIDDTVKTYAEDADFVYTLSSLPVNLIIESGMKEIQDEIPEIAEILVGGVNNPQKAKQIKNNFPVMKCPHCGSESFKIDANITFYLHYGKRSRRPILEGEDFPEYADFECVECRNSLELEGPEDEFCKLLGRVENAVF